MIDTGGGGGFMGAMNRMAAPLNNAAQKYGAPKMRGMNKQIGAGMARPGGLGGPGMAHPNMGMPNMVQGPSNMPPSPMMGQSPNMGAPPMQPPSPMQAPPPSGLGTGMGMPSGGMSGGMGSFINPNMAGELWKNYNSQAMPNMNQQAPGLNRQVMY